MDYSNLKVPNHVAIILDGNGRWATSRGLRRSDGHKAGFENLKTLSKYVFSKGIKYLSVFAFSTENFKRSKEEVDYLMNLFATSFKTYGKDMKKENIKVVFSGIRKAPLPKNVIAMMSEVEEMTKDCDRGVFNICINYGGQSEIVDAAKKIALEVKNGNLDVDDITIDNFDDYFYQDLPNIDLLIRTSGELRISNFMLWKASYAEFYFPLTHFPDFDEKEFDLAILEYTKRDRRFGGINYAKKDS